MIPMNIKNNVLKSNVSRRNVIKAGATGGLLAAAGGISLPFTNVAQAAQSKSSPEEKAVWSYCTVN